MPAEAQPACGRSDGSEMRDALWQRANRKHPLAGLVLKGAQPIPVAPDRCVRSPLQQLVIEIWSTIRGGGIVLLGDVHDNPEHHAVRADMLRPRLEPMLDVDDLQPAVAFEHIRTTHQPQLDAFFFNVQSKRRPTAADLLEDLRWKDSGWPAAEIYLPLFDAAIKGKMPFVPAAPDRDRMRSLVRGDRAGASENELALLRSAERMPASLREALAAELEGSHCRTISPASLPAMSMAQRYIDAHMAARALEAAVGIGSAFPMGGRRGAFLLAGNGHVRTDRGVPWYLKQRAPTRQTISVMLLEVEEGKTDPSGYIPRDPYGNPAADYTLFTPRHDRPDPCEKMRQGKAPN
jgi:uncharacterized iron-regulated protein